jgi:ATP-binding cassette subfamily F protein uup
MAEAGVLLLALEGVSKQFGQRPLFEGISFGVSAGDRLGIVGPNGSGKSTLLAILAGRLEPDAGRRSVQKHLTMALVEQERRFDPTATAEDVVLSELASAGLEDFERHARAARALGRVGFTDREAVVATLSGGWKKRLALACALAREPEVLLLDEPTNHLDLEGILQLEKLLQDPTMTVVVISHDRWFLENVATRMLELDRRYPAGALAVDGSYADLLERRDEALAREREYQETLANRARRELEWLRRGPKARTRKSKARIDAAGELFDELGASRERLREERAGIELAATGRQTKRLLEAHGLGKSFGPRTILAGIELLLKPKTRLGVLGPNGSGKTTLLSLLDGSLEPDQGHIERAAALQVVRFEQGRDSLDLDLTLRRELAPDSDSVRLGEQVIHVASYARRFLFRSEQLEQPVRSLSGGEQARLVLARLLLRPADLLILDEPTNDLDIPTLEVLEEALLEFPGALVLVTHDRYLLERVSTSLLALDGRGRAVHLADLAQWEQWLEEHRESEDRPREVASKPARPAPAKKLSYHEQREWDRMEELILEAEESVERARAAAEDPAVATDGTELMRRHQSLADAETRVADLYARWAELEAKRGG